VQDRVGLPVLSLVRRPVLLPVHLPVLGRSLLVTRLRAVQPLFNVVTVQMFSFAREMETVSFAPTRIAVTTIHLGVDAVQGRILQHRLGVMIVLLVCVVRER
jgi:hypothetical protein